MSDNKKEQVAYGSLYVDKGENFELIKKQIDYFADNKPSKVFFEVLGREQDRKVGEWFIGRVVDYTKEKLPYLADKDIHCSFSVDLKD